MNIERPTLNDGTKARTIAPASAMARWQPEIHAAAETANTISILDFIGEDIFGEGVTVRRIAGVLRNMSGPVDVVINSPGGDLFEGLAIYNTLREYDGDVTVRVVGMAASAASVIAMAGDTVQVARAGFLMIHNAWTCVCGNRNDLRAIADTMEEFDDTMAGVYAAHTGGDRADMAAMMDAETWIGGERAIELGFADALLASDEIDTAASAGQKHAIAAKKMDMALARAGISRADRRKMMSEFKSGTRNATGGGMLSAADDMQDAVINLNLEPLAQPKFSI